MAASRRVLHHSVATMVAPAPDGANADVEDGGAFIVEYASGKAPELYPDDSGVLLKAGHTLNLGTHLHPVGEEVKAEVEIGFKLYPKGVTPKYIRYSTHHGDPRPDANETLDIPAGGVVRTDGYTLHTKPGKIIAFQPHMHIRGKYQCMELIYPSNPSKIMQREMINCAHWDYNWHLVYNYADEVGADRAGRDDRAHHQLARQLGQHTWQPRPEELGRLRSAHHRRDGLRVDRVDRFDAGGV